MCVSQVSPFPLFSPITGECDPDAFEHDLEGGELGYDFMDESLNEPEEVHFPSMYEKLQAEIEAEDAEREKKKIVRFQCAKRGSYMVALFMCTNIMHDSDADERGTVFAVLKVGVGV